MSSKPVAGGGIWKGCRPMVLGAGESSVTAFRSYTVSDLEGFGRGVVQWPCIFFNGLALYLF